MKKIIEKLIGRFEEVSIPIFDKDTEMESKVIFADIAKNIANELAEEYKDSEEQGLLLRLPCKIGDELWWFDAFGDLRTSKVNSMFVEFGIDGIVIETLICNVYANDIGKTVFLTKEEAEQALKQMGE